MRKGQKKGLRAIGADVSALILISFIFQLLTPIVVLAGDRQNESAFEASLRESICLVHVEEASQNTQTDEFLCDLCILSGGDLPSKVLASSYMESTSFDRHGDSYKKLAFADTHSDQVLGNLSAPRAPPFL